MGKIITSGTGCIIKDMIVRWNERQVTKDSDMPTTEFLYDAHRFDYLLPVEVSPGREAVEYFLESAKETIVVLAQNMAEQEAGLIDIN